METEDKSWKEIESMQGGDKVKRALETVLKRERNWVSFASLSPMSETVLMRNEVLDRRIGN